MRKFLRDRFKKIACYAIALSIFFGVNTSWVLAVDKSCCGGCYAYNCCPQNCSIGNDQIRQCLCLIKEKICDLIEFGEGTDGCDLTIKTKIDHLHVTMESKLDKIIDEFECGDFTEDVAIDCCAGEDMLFDEIACSEDVPLKGAVFRILDRSRLLKCIAKKVCNIECGNVTVIAKCDDGVCLTVSSKVDELHVTMESKLDKIIDEVCECRGELGEVGRDICFEGDSSHVCDSEMSLRTAVFGVLNRTRWIRGIAEKVCELVEDTCCLTVSSKVDQLHVTMESKLDKIIGEVSECRGFDSIKKPDIPECFELALDPFECDDESISLRSAVFGILNQAVLIEYIGKKVCELVEDTCCLTVNSKVDQLHVTMESKLDKIICDLGPRPCETLSCDCICTCCDCAPYPSLRKVVDLICCKVIMIESTLCSIGFILNGICTKLIEIGECCNETNQNTQTIITQIDHLHVTMESKLDKIISLVENIEFDPDICFTIDSKLDQLHVTMESKLDRIDERVGDFADEIPDCCNLPSDLDSINQTSFSLQQWAKAIFYLLNNQGDGCEPPQV